MKQARCQVCRAAESTPFGPFPDLRRGRRVGVSLGGIIACCVGATLALTAPVSQGQEQPILTAPAQPASDPTAPLSPAPAMEQYEAVSRWVREWGSPSGAAPGVPCAAVTLRLDGIVVGRGTVLATDGTAVSRAAAAAMVTAAKRLPWPHDAVGERERREEAKKLLVSLELGGQPVPIKASTWLEFDLLVQPGCEGVAVRVGEKEEVMFPGQMLASGYAPSEAAVALLSRVSEGGAPVVRTDPKSQPPRLEANRGATFYKVRVQHLAQWTPERSPVFMFRGGKVVRSEEVTSAALRTLTADLAANLCKRIVHRKVDPGSALLESREIAVLSGTLRLGASVSGEPAGPFETLLAVHALRSFALLDSADAGARGAAAGAAEELLRGLFAPGEAPEKMKPEVSAALIIALTTEPDARGSVPPAVLAAAVAGVESAYVAGTGWKEGVAPGARSLIALALARLGSPKAEEGLRSIYAQTPPKLLASQMPYLGWAELELARNLDRVPAATALLDMRADVWEHQLTAGDAGEDGPDLIGGIVFTNTATPLPSWLGMKPVAFLATMARDPRLTEQDAKLKELLRLSNMGRFVRQLAVDEYAAHAATDHDRAMWGVRSAVWDPRQPPEAQAMALLLMTEVVRTLDSFSVGARNP
ncbi:MAG: hypothetical protein ACOYN0_17200 [Phycisphaerales bacterium]